MSDDWKEDDTHELLGHQWLRYSSENGSRPLARQLVRAYLAFVTGEELSIRAWNKRGTIPLTWVDKRGISRRTQTEFESIVRLVQRTGDLRTKEHGLQPIQSNTYPPALHIASNFTPRSDSTGTVKLHLANVLGETFPLEPSVDRESVIYTTLEKSLSRNVVRLRTRLVATSDVLLEQDSGWFEDFRAMLNDIVSAIDCALTTLYLQAQFAPKNGWAFEPDRLGDRSGRRMVDKLNWVYRITGEHLQEHHAVAAFHELRGVRNHLTHFDPPCFVYSVDDVVRWLNLVPEAGKVVWAIRRCSGEPIFSELVRWLMLRPVELVPLDPNLPRPPQEPDCGYASVRWAMESGEVDDPS